MKPNVMMKTTSPEANDETSWREGVGEDVEDFEVGEDDEQVPPPPSSSSSLSRLFHPFASWWCKLLKTFVNKHSNHTHNLLNINTSTATKDEEDVTEENSFEYKHTTHSCRSLFTIMGICLVLLLLLSLLKLAVPSLGTEDNNNLQQRTVPSYSKLRLATLLAKPQPETDSFDFVKSSSAKLLGDECANCIRDKYLEYFKGCIARRTPECPDCIQSFDCDNLKQQQQQQRRRHVLDRVNVDVAISQNNTSKSFSEQCFVDGKYYSIGQRVAVASEPCKVCSCIKRYDQSMAKVHCSRRRIECPEIAFGVPPDRGCYFSYEDNKCCGRQICPEQLPADDKHRQVCAYKDRVYHFGEVIYPEEDNCQRCMCDENWAEGNYATSSCRRIPCHDWKGDKYTKCVPIFSKNACCPIDFICPTSKDKSTEREVEFDTDDEDISPTSNKETEEEEEDINDKPKAAPKSCRLNDQVVSLDQPLFVRRHRVARERTCATCRCFLPPAVTCIVNYDCEPPRNATIY